MEYLQFFSEYSRINSADEIRAEINRRGQRVVMDAFGVNQGTAAKFLSESDEIKINLDGSMRLIEMLGYRVVHREQKLVPPGWVTIPVEWAISGFLSLIRQFGANGVEQNAMRRMFIAQVKRAPDRTAA